MKALSVIKKIISRGCIINTVLVILLYSLGLLANGNFIPTIDRIFGILLFSLALAGANIFVFSKVLTFPLRLLIHYLFTAFMFYVLFILWGNYSLNGGAAIVIFVMFTLIYGAVAGIVAIVRSIFKEKNNSKKEYKKVIKKDDDYKSVFGGNK